MTFAGLLDSETDEGIGVVEVLLSSALSGIIFSVFAGQPLAPTHTHTHTASLVFRFTREA